MKPILTLVVMIAAASPAFADTGNESWTLAQPEEDYTLLIGLRYEYGYGGDSANGSIFALEAEIPVGEYFSIAAYVISYEYEWDNGEDLQFGEEAEEEEGEGLGVGLEARIYFTGNQVDGFYIGAGFSVFFDAEYEFKGDANLNGVYEAGEIEEDDSASFEVHGAMGYAIWLGDRIVLSPSLIIGTYISDSPEAGFFAGVGLHLSVRF